nr:MAG TPA: AcrIIC3 protein [Caudoviricetes sp.]
MHKQTKETSIPRKVKEMVWERDKGRCIICGSRYAAPNAHYISRAQGGRGVEQNIVTLCAECHRGYDQTPLRPVYRRMIQAYLMAEYPHMREDDLRYKKGRTI